MGVSEDDEKEEGLQGFLTMTPPPSFNDAVSNSLNQSHVFRA